MYELKVETDFAAAHRLTMVGEKCENLHGHNWKIEVIVAGENLDEGGVLIDFGIIKQHVRAVMETLDHKFLNELAFFSDAVPPIQLPVSAWSRPTCLKSTVPDSWTCSTIRPPTG